MLTPTLSHLAHQRTCSILRWWLLLLTELCLLLQAAKDFQEAIQKIPELRLVGRPDMCNVAFTGATPSANIYALNDLMTAKGWHLNALQRPAAVHMCFTAQHIDIVDDLIKVKFCHTVLSSALQVPSACMHACRLPALLSAVVAW